MASGQNERWVPHEKWAPNDGLRGKCGEKRTGRNHSPAPRREHRRAATELWMKREAEVGGNYYSKHHPHFTFVVLVHPLEQYSIRFFCRIESIR